MCCIITSIFILAVVALLAARRLSRRALAARRAMRANEAHGIKAQTDGFRVHEPLRVAFLHPDLGIGGAERLIIDAAMSLQNIERQPNPMSPNSKLPGATSRPVSRRVSPTIPERRGSIRQSTTTTATTAASITSSSTSTPNLVATPSAPNAALRIHRRYDVQIFTNYHDPKRAFEETTDGTLQPPIVLADWIPRHIKNKGHVLFASLRMIVAAIIIVFKYQLSKHTAFDVIIVDQVAAVMPILKLLAPSWKIYFYCHFPDQLCDPSRMADLNAAIDAKAKRQGEGGKATSDNDAEGVATAPASVKLAANASLFQRAKHTYRTLFDQIEIMSMKAADRVNYNSKFSREVTMSVFPFLKAQLDDSRDILYPPIDVEKALREPVKPLSSSSSSSSTTDDLKVDGFSDVTESAFNALLSTHRVLTSINRFERKKNIPLAVEAVAAYARANMPNLAAASVDGTTIGGITNSADNSPTRAHSTAPIRVAESLIEGDKTHLPLALVICGGYDPRLPENVSHHEELLRLCTVAYKDVFRPVTDLASYLKGVALAAERKNFVHREGSIDPIAACAPAKSLISALTDADVEEITDPRIPVLFLRSCTSRAKYLLLKKAAVVLYTPEREHFGIVPVEAMCFGVPVIAVSNGGPTESIGFGDVNGFLRPSNPTAFGEALCAALDTDKAEAISRNATARASDVFSLGAFGTKLSVQLEELARMA